MRVIIFILLLAATSWAQLTVQGPEAVYEGQNVSAVDLIGDPNHDLKPFRDLVAQKSGTPYSQEKIEASIAALRGTGKFPKVEVSIVPDLTGLRLDFLLSPVYYLGIVDFPGATKVFSYARLLQVVDLRDQDPFDKARLPDAENALSRFLNHSGYFQAKVTSSTEIDDAHELVNVRFNVELGKQARIGNVTLEGLAGDESAHLQHSVRSLRARFTGGLLKPGKPYAPERMKQATSLIRRALAKEQRLASKVKVLPPQFHADTNRVDVAFNVEAGPIVVVRIDGARLSWIPFLSSREKKKLIPIYSEGTIDEDLVHEGGQNLVNFFQRKGYFDVQVKTSFRRTPTQVLLTYDINQGEKHKVDRIVFEGNHQLSTKDLSNQATVKKAHFWSHGAFSQKLLRQSADNIQALYRDRGFETAKVTPHAAERGTKIDVSFNIEEGLQTLVDDVTITGNNALDRLTVTKPSGLTLEPGKPFSPRLMLDDRNRIAANYQDRGFLNVEVKPNVRRVDGSPQRVDVTYEVTEHQEVLVKDIVYLGQRHTRPWLIHNSARLSPERPMRRGDLLQAQSRLYDLNIFDWASVGPERPITDQDDESILVKVHEAKRNEIIYGLGFEVSHRGGNVPAGSVAVPGGPPVQLNGNKIAPSQATYASPRGSIELNRRNMRGLGETASAALLLSRLDQRLLTTYAQPNFAGSHWQSLSTFSIERTTENPLFAASLGDLSFQLERVINHKTNTRLQLRYDFNKTILSHLLVPELVLQQDRNVHLSTFSGTLLRDTRDKPLDAHHGMFETLTLSMTPKALFSSASFAKFFGQYAFYKPVRSIVFANSVRLGLVAPFGSSFVPTSQLFFSGGGTTLRGFPIDEAGPQRIVPFCNVLQGQTGCVNITVPVGGRQLFILNSEMRFPLKVFKALGGVLFYDGGNVYSAVNLHTFVDNYTNTIGIGLRYSTPIGPVRFDIGKNVNPVPGISSVQYYITLGQAF